MAATVSRMTKRELQEIIESAVERKILELLGDPDAGVRIRASLRSRLLRQKRAVARGERGEPLEAVARRLGLE